jgi:hypothetical protein
MVLMCVVCQAFWICGFVAIIQFGNFLATISYDGFSGGFQLHVRPLEVLHVSSRLWVLAIILDSFCYHLQAHWSFLLSHLT